MQVKKGWIENGIVVVLAVMCFLAMRQCASNGQERDDAIRTIGHRDTVIDVFWDKMGRQHNIIREREMSVQVLEESHDSELVALRADYEGKLKNLQSRTVVRVVTTDTVQTVVHDTIRPDGEKGRTFEYSDEWARIHGSLFDTTASLAYAFRTGVTLDRMWKRPKWYKRKELYLDVRMDNPHAMLQNVQTFVITPERKKWWQTDLAKCLGSFALGQYLGTRK